MNLSKLAMLNRAAMAVTAAASVITVAAYAGEGAPFAVGVFASASVQIGADSVLDEDHQLNAASAPAVAEAIFPDGVAFASTSFTEFQNRAVVAGDSIPPGSFSISSGEVRDTVTINLNGDPSGTTRLEIGYSIGGFFAGILSGNANYSIKSSYNHDANEYQVSFAAGDFRFDTPGFLDTEVTFIYDDVPLNTPWNLQTSVIASAPGQDAAGESDFRNGTLLTGVTLFIDNIRVPAQIAGSSGTIYASLPGDYILAQQSFRVRANRFGQQIDPQIGRADRNGFIENRIRAIFISWQRKRKG